MADNAKGDNFGLPKGLTNGAVAAVQSLTQGGSDFVNFVKGQQSNKQLERDPELTFQVQMMLSEVADLQSRLIKLKAELQKK